jgi:branched-chain amino acid aminotransferase
MIGLTSPAVTQGLGLFETLLAVRGRATQPAEHFARLAASATSLGFPSPSEETFLSAIGSAGREVDSFDEAALRCLYIATGKEIDDPSAWQLAATASPMPPITLRRRALGRLVTLDRDLSRALPAHKSTSYAVCAIGLRQAVAAGADEGAFVTADGLVLEGTSTNLFALEGERLITAPVTAGILPGVVRASVLLHARQLGLLCEERPPSAAELLAGSFMTSSLTLLAPIRSLNGAPCAAPGPRFAELGRRYADASAIA